MKRLRVLFGGHFGLRKPAEKVLQSGFYWPTLFKDAYEFCKTFPKCQMVGRISKRDMMPLNPILEIELFDVWTSTLWVYFLTHLETNIY